MTVFGKLKLEARGEREVYFERDFDAPRAMVFDAHTKPELIRRWLLGPQGWTMPVCDVDLRVGGRFRYEWKNADGRTMGMGGTFREIVRPERIVHVEIFDEDWTGGEAISTMKLTERAGRTSMTLSVLYSTAAARDGALKTGMADGMETGYVRLDDIVQELARS